MMPAKPKTPTNPIIQRIMADGIFSGGQQSTQGGIGAAMQSTFNNLRGMPSSAPTFGEQNAMANAGVYQAGTFGAQNAMANGLPVAGRDVPFGGPNVSETQSPVTPDGINSALNPFGGGLGGMAPSLPGGSPSSASNIFATPGIPMPQGAGVAMGVQGMRQMADEERQRRLFINPYIPTPGMAPEMAASRFGYLDKLAMQAGGQTPSQFSNPVTRGVDAAGKPTLTNRQMNGGTSLGKPTGAAPTTTAYDQNRQAVMAQDQVGKQAIQQAIVTEQAQKALAAGLPRGYVVDPANPARVRPMEGSLEELQYKKLQQEMAGVEQEKRDLADKHQMRLDSERETANTVTKNIDYVLENTNALTAGAPGKIGSVVWGTDSYDMKAAVETIKANIGFDRLQQMRKESPTGGALGQVAVRELDFLQATLGNLDQAQSPERFKENLRAAKRHYERFLKAEAGINPDAKAQKVGRFEVIAEGQ